MEILVNKISSTYSDILDKRNSISHKLSEITGLISSKTQLIESSKSKIRELSQINPVSEEEYSSIKLEYDNRQNLYQQCNDDILKLNSELNDLNKNHYKFSSEIPMNQKYLEECQNQLLSYLDSKCPMCGSQIDCADKIKECQKKILDLTDILENLEERSKKNELDISNLTNVINSKRNESSDLLNGQQERLKIIKDYEQTLNSISIYESSIKESEESIKELSLKQNELDSDIKILDKELEIANYYKNAVSKKFRTYLLDEVLNYMNSVLKTLSKFLYEVQGSVKLVASGNDIKIYLGDREFGALSGGEGRRVDLILQLAQRQLCEVQSGFSCNLLVIDEILDYLDAVGVDNVLSLLEANSTSVETLMLVTHRPDLNITFDTILTVVKGEDQMSKLVWK